MFKYIVGGIAAVVVVAATIYGVRWVTAPVVGELHKRETVQSGAFRKHSYEHFYDLCASIQRKQRSLQAQESLDSERSEQNAAALRAQLQGDISQYNADARKEETMGQFRDNGLPRTIQYEEEVIQCR